MAAHPNSSALLHQRPPRAAELLTEFVLTDELKLLQDQMRELFRTQKANGGIIDLEEEKNKFFVSVATPADLEAPTVKEAPKDQPKPAAPPKQKKEPKEPRKEGRWQTNRYSKNRYRKISAENRFQPDAPEPKQPTQDEAPHKPKLEPNCNYDRNRLTYRKTEKTEDKTPKNPCEKIPKKPDAKILKRKDMKIGKS